MAFCSNCGASLKPEQRFCVQCGSPHANSSSTLGTHQAPQPNVSASSDRSYNDVRNYEVELALSIKKLQVAEHDISKLRNELEDKNRHYVNSSGELSNIRNQVRKLNSALANSQAELEEIKKKDTQHEDQKIKLDKYEKLLLEQNLEINAQKQSLKELNIQLINANLLSASPSLKVEEIKTVSVGKEKRKKGSTLAWVTAAVLFLGVFSVGGWYYYDNYININKKISNAEEAFMAQKWNEGLAIIHDVSTNKMDLIHSINDDDRLYLDSLVEFIKVAKSDIEFLKQKFDDGGMDKLNTVNFALNKVSNWPAIPKNSDSKFFSRTTNDMLAPFIQINDSVRLAALDFFVASGVAIVIVDDDYQIKNGQLEYGAGQIVSGVYHDLNKTNAQEKLENIKQLTASIPSIAKTETNKGVNTSVPKPVTNNPPASANDTKPTAYTIKSSLVGKNMSDWKFSNLSEFKTFKILSQKQEGNSLRYNIESVLKDASGDLFLARFDVLYNKTSQSEWAFTKVVQTYFDYQ